MLFLDFTNIQNTLPKEYLNPNNGSSRSTRKSSNAHRKKDQLGKGGTGRADASVDGAQVKLIEFPTIYTLLI